MKKELLRIKDLSIPGYNGITPVKASFSIYCGECLSLLGLEYSGKDSVVKFLTELIPYSFNHFRIEETVSFDFSPLRDKVYLIQKANYELSYLMVAEYLFLFNENYKWRWFQSKRKLMDKTEKALNEFGIHIDPSVPLSYLSEVDKRIIDFLKALILKKRLIVIQDSFDGCSDQEIKIACTFMKKFLPEESAIVICSYHPELNEQLCDRFFYFSEGRIQKIGKREEMNKFWNNGVFSPENEHRQFFAGRETFRVIFPQILDIREHELNFHSSEITALLSNRMQTKKNIFELIAGRSYQREMKFYVDGMHQNLRSPSDFIKNKIMSISNFEKQLEIFTNMSIGENIILPSLNKISNLEYLVYGRRLTKMLKHELKLDYVMEGSMSSETLMKIILERCKVFLPKVLIVYEPFVFFDSQTVNIIGQYILNLTLKGVTTIIISSQNEQIERLADRVIFL